MFHAEEMNCETFRWLRRGGHPPQRFPRRLRRKWEFITHLSGG